MDKIKKIQLEVTEESEGTRIDKFISEQCDEMSRSFIQRLIKEESVLVDGKVIKSNYKVVSGNIIDISIPEPVETDILPENLSLNIIYEDSDVILINKPKGMVVHPAAGHYTGTVVNGLMYHCRDNLSGINGVLRPGIVHRIDRDTTGVIIACKNDYSHNFIAEQLKEHTITRKYNALVTGVFKEPSGTVNAPVGRHPIDRKRMAINHKNGKEAVTHYQLLENFGKRYAHIECMLETGRTHQIRVHMSSINHPLLGDEVYGAKKGNFQLEGQALHARVFGFIHPLTKKYMEFEAPMPDYFSDLIQKFKNIQ